MPNINVTGCCLIDYLFENVDFGSDLFKPMLSESEGDGGIVPGKLVFVDVFEEFMQKSTPEIIGNIVNNFGSPKTNLGGPAVVAAIHAAQILFDTHWNIFFYGGRSNDETGNLINTYLEKTPVEYFETILPGQTPVTWVFSDPQWNNGKGERAFLGDLGTSALYSPGHLGKRFFDAGINVYGGTALVPAVHGDLSALLQKGREAGSLQIVNTVYDFVNQQKDCMNPWPMGDGDTAYRYIDLLITDLEEALRLSGRKTPEAAVNYFLDMGVSAAVITRGHDDVLFAAAGGRFVPSPLSFMPVSREAVRVLEEERSHFRDTTGCGDNFAGGIIANMAVQIDSGEKLLDLSNAVPHGIAAGGFACLYIGGTLFESYAGEKREMLKRFYNPE